MKNKFAATIKELRLEIGLSQSLLSERIGVSKRIVSAYEKGLRECDFDTLIKLSKLFDVSTDCLLGLADY